MPVGRIRYSFLKNVLMIVVDVGVDLSFGLRLRFRFPDLRNFRSAEFAQKTFEFIFRGLRRCRDRTQSRTHSFDLSYLPGSLHSPVSPAKLSATSSKSRRSAAHAS